VWLGNVEARVRFIASLPVSFLGLWCHSVARVGGGLHKLLVVGGEDFGYIVGVVEVDWH
jgi:hypothetical protein